MNDRRYLIRVSLAAVVTALIEIHFSFTRRAAPTRMPTLSDTLLYVFGGALLGKGVAFRFILYFLIPPLLLCFSLADYVQGDFVTCCVYLFTRSKGRGRWMTRKALGLLAGVTGYYLLVFILSIFSYSCRGTRLTGSFAAEAAVIMLFTVLSSYMLILPINLLAVRLGTVQAFILCTAVYVAMLFAGRYAPPEISMLLPFSQGNYAWHQPLWAGSVPAETQCTLPGFSPVFSLAYLLIGILIELFFGAFFLKRMDLLDAPEGEN